MCVFGIHKLCTVIERAWCNTASCGAIAFYDHHALSRYRHSLIVIIFTISITLFVAACDGQSAIDKLLGNMGVRENVYHEFVFF